MLLPDYREGSINFKLVNKDKRKLNQHFRLNKLCQKPSPDILKKKLRDFCISQLFIHQVIMSKDRPLTSYGVIVPMVRVVPFPDPDTTTVNDLVTVVYVLSRITTVRVLC